MRRNIMVGGVLVPVCILGSVLSFYETNTSLLFALYPNIE